VGITEANSRMLRQDVTQAPPAERTNIIRDGGSSAGGGSQGNQVKNKPACSSKTTSMPDDNTKIINDWLRPNGVMNTANRDRLKKLVAGIGDCFIVAQFLTAKELAQNRKQFVQTLRDEGQIPSP
jgi:hypothetical protein